MGATGKRRMSLRQARQLRTATLMCLPAVLLYTAFVAYPVLQALRISLYNWSGFTPNMAWVGSENYRMVLSDSVFWGSLRNNGLLVVVPGFFTLLLAIYFANVLAGGVKWANLYRVAYFFPNVLSFVVIATLWSFIYHPDWGILNSALRALHLGSLARPWLASDNMISAIYAPIVWCSVGFFMLIYLAAIQQIPEELFEAAKVDGANSLQVFRAITWPMLAPINRVAVVFIVLGGLKAFDFIWVFSYGQPILKNHTMATWVYQKAFTESDFGYGTALSVVMFVMVFAASLVTMRAMKGPRFQE